MHLSDWFSKQNMTQQALADNLGVTQGRVAQLLSGATPSWSLAARIQEATHGAVTPNDFLQEREREAS